MVKRRGKPRPRSQARYQLPDDLIEQVKLRAVREKTAPCRLVEKFISAGLRPQPATPEHASAVP